MKLKILLLKLLPRIPGGNVLNMELWFHVHVDQRMPKRFMTTWNDASCHRGHYSGDIMSTMASQITSLTIVYSTVYSGADQRNIKAPRRWPLCGEITGDWWPDVIMWNKWGNSDFLYHNFHFISIVRQEGKRHAISENGSPDVLMY